MCYIFKDRSSILRKISLLLMSFFFLAALPLFAELLPTDNSLYVTVTGAGLKNGSSWENAAEGAAGLQAALAVAEIKDIHVGAGTYAATTTNPNPANTGNAPTCFVIPTGVSGSYSFRLLGGYPAEGGVAREPAKHLTILTRADTLTHARIVYMKSFTLENLDYSSTIDGFTISNGLLSTTGNGNARNGAGICAGDTAAHTPRRIVNCVIKNNINKHTGQGAGGKGGGLYVACQTITIDSCLITENKVLLENGLWGAQSVHGGGIHAVNNLNLSNSIVSKNQVVNKSNAPDNIANVKGAYGGGIYFEQAFFSQIKNTLITENACQVVSVGGNCVYQPQGGGVYIVSADINGGQDRQCTFNRCMITKNYTTLVGSDNGNKREPYGAGVCVNDGSKANFYSCLIANNGLAASDHNIWGAGVANLAEVSKGNVVLTNCTIVRNCSGGEGTRTGVQGVTLKNCILAGNGKSDNTATKPGHLYNAINSFVGGDNTITLPDYFENPSATLGKDDATANVSWALNAECAAIDAGDSTLWTLPGGNIGVVDILKDSDLASKKRLIKGSVDQGAYEYQFPLLVMEESTKRIYVKKIEAGNGDGSSWDNATSRLQTAIDLPDVKEVWVAAGTYKPTKSVEMCSESSVSSKMFQMKEGVNVYGGFVGTESALTDRVKGDKPWIFTNATILDGDLDGNGTKSVGDAQHVIYFPVEKLANDNSANFNYTTETIVNGFTIQNGYAGNGTGTYSAGGGFDKCGGVQMVGKSILSECIVQNNKGTWEGGGIRLGGTGAKIDSCLVTSNSAAGAGGGIYMNGTTETAAITGCEIKNNTAAGSGGGIYTQGAITVTDCQIANNTSTGSGGGIYTQGAITVTDCQIANNTSTGSGGALHVTGPISLNNCLFVNNHAANGDGGAVALVAGSNNSTVTNCTFLNNSTSSDTSGGAIFTTVNDVSFINCVVANNEGEHGGGICLRGSSKVTNCTIVNNKGRSGYAGGLRTAGGTTTVLNTIIWGNTNNNDTSKSQIGDNVANVGNAIENATFTNCAVEWSEFSETSCIQLTATNTESTGPQFILPSLSSGPGNTDAIYASWRLSNNSPCATAGITTGAPLQDIEGTTRGNSISLGAYCAVNESPASPITTVTGTLYMTLEGLGTKDGSSWMNALPYARLIEAIATAGVTEVKMASGEYSTYGVIELPANKTLSGGYDVTDPANVTRSLAPNAKYPWDFAARTQITNRGANARVLAISGATLDGVEIFGSTGGGVDLMTDGSKIKNSIIRNCSVTGNGGGILVSGGTAEVEGCFVHTNAATARGGAIFKGLTGELVIRQSSLANNKATINGGGIQHDAGILKIYNTIIAGNHLPSNQWGGGGILTANGNLLSVYSSTIVNNRSGSLEDGGGIRITNGAATIVNTIIWGNLKDTEKNQIHGSVTLTNCAVEGRTADAQNLNLDADNGHVGGPNFVLPKAAAAADWNGANWQLTNVSPCIDAGSGNAPEKDILGVKRPTYLAIDMGCYEYAGDESPRLPGTYYVSPTGTGNGSSWDNAADGCNENLFKTANRIIYMKEGVYRSKKPDGHRYNCGVNGLKVYGGFSNTSKGTDLLQRDVKKMPTVISGQRTTDAKTGIIWEAKGVFDGIEFRDGSSDKPGGALQVNGPISLNNCLFVNNYSAWDGGAVALVTGSNNSTVTNCTFLNNSNASGKSGGAIFTAVNVNDVSFINCVVANNEGEHGGGICLQGNSKVTNCTIVNNKGRSTYAGGLRTAGGTTTVLNTIIWGNTNNNGASKSQIGNNTGNGGNAIENATFTNCAVEWSEFSEPSGIRLTAINTEATGPQFIMPSLSSGLGNTDAIYASWRLLNPSPCATAGTTTGAPSQDIEGTTRGSSISLGAYCAVPPIAVTDATLYMTLEGLGKKDGSSWANALPYARLIEAIATAGVTEVKMASGEYVALRVIELPANKTLSGGYDVTDPANVTRSLAPHAKYPWDFAARTQITNRGANTRVLAISGATLDGVEIFGSTGGGVDLMTDGSKIKNSIIRNCSHTVDGGGVLVSGGTAEIEGCFVHTNAANRGGAIFKEVAGELVIRQSSLANNKATANGGGIQHLDGILKIYNTIIAGNHLPSTGWGGGGILTTKGDSLFVYNSTIVNNRSGTNEGSGGIRITTGTATIVNTIIWGNLKSAEKKQFDGGVTLTNCAVEGRTADAQNLNLDADNGHVGGPNFVSPKAVEATDWNNANWALQQSSPCVNRGKALTDVICDIVGAPRPMGGEHDMGAFEYIDKITPAITGINNVYFTGTPILIQGVHPLQDSTVTFSSDGSSYASTSMPVEQGKYKVKIVCAGNTYFNEVTEEKDFYVTHDTAYVSVSGTNIYGNQEYFAGAIPFTHLQETIDLAGVTDVCVEGGTYQLTKPLTVPTGKKLLGGFSANNARTQELNSKPWDFTNKTEFHVCGPVTWTWGSGWTVSSPTVVTAGFPDGNVATIAGTVDGVTFRDMYTTALLHSKVTVNGGTLQNSIVKRFYLNINNGGNELIVGVHITGANSVVKNCYIGENQNVRSHSESLSGMLVAATGAVVDNCTFAQNQTTAGGVLKVNNANCIVKNSTFVNNAVNHGSYMVFANGHPVTVENALIAYNARVGGNANSGNVGSAVFKVKGTSGKMIARNCTIIKNKTSGAGHAQILMADGTVAGADLSNCIIWDNNTGNTAAIFVGTGTFNLSNCAYDVSMATGANSSANPLGILNSANPGFVTSPVTAAGLLTTDQMNAFLASDLGLTALSLCVNRGNNSLKPAGMTPQMGYVDIGAYESAHKGVMASWVITLPALQNNTIASSWPTLPKSLFTFVAEPASPNFTADCTAGHFSYGPLTSGMATYAVAFDNWKVTDESAVGNKVSITVKDPITVTMVDGTIDSLRIDYSTEKATKMIAYEGYVASIDTVVKTNENFNNWKVETKGTLNDQYQGSTQYILGAADATVTAEYIAEDHKRYVSQAGAGSKKGYNWANAADSLKLTNIINTSIVKHVYIGEGRFEAVANGGTDQGSNSVSAFTLPAGKRLTGGHVANAATLDSSKTIITLAPTSSNARVLRMENGTTSDSTVIETLTISGGNITSGSTLQSDGVKHLGGGLFMAGANTFVNNCRVVDNYAKSGGGGIYLGGGTVVNSLIKGNTASDAALFVDNVSSLNCFRAGAGIYMVGGLLDHVVVDSNYVKETITLTQFSGGGVLMRGGEIKNSIITRNGATTGAGILAAGTSPKITQCTIVENKATKPQENVITTGAGISVLNSSLTLKNAIVWGNSSATDSQISGTPTFDHCAVEATGTQVPGVALPTDVNSFYLHADNENQLGPRFKNLINYEPKEGSVLINRAKK